MYKQHPQRSSVSSKSNGVRIGGRDEADGAEENGGVTVIVHKEADGALTFTRRKPLPATRVNEDEITRNLLVKLE